jgi:hypothetical protein
MTAMPVVRQTTIESPEKKDPQIQVQERRPSGVASTRWARSKAQFTEFRKRYLNFRRLIFWTIWLGVHTGLFVYGW